MRKSQNTFSEPVCKRSVGPAYGFTHLKFIIKTLTKQSRGSYMGYTEGWWLQILCKFYWIVLVDVIDMNKPYARYMQNTWSEMILRMNLRCVKPYAGPTLLLHTGSEKVFWLFLIIYDWYGTNKLRRWSDMILGMISRIFIFMGPPSNIVYLICWANPVISYM